MYLVRQILESKGYQVWWTRPDATVFDALRIMSEKDVGALVVLENDGKLAGIFSERDYARKVILFEKNSKDTLPSSHRNTTLTHHQRQRILG